jgi:hypothetical protein
VALLFCGRCNGSERHIFTAREVVPIPIEICKRQPDRITWPTDRVDPLLTRAFGKQQAIIKVHSHPGGFREFSVLDDQSDTTLFSSIISWLDDEMPHASVIMLPDGEPHSDLVVPARPRLDFYMVVPGPPAGVPPTALAELIPRSTPTPKGNPYKPT